MGKLIKVIVLLAIVVGMGFGFWLWVQQQQDEMKSGEAGLRARKPDEPPMRVEEKYGFTTETVAP